MALQYKIITMSTKWDDTYNNTMYFDTREAQYEYFGIPTVFDTAIEVNFPVGSLVNATVTYRGVAGNLQELMNDNYCIIQNSGNADGTPEYFFYFIKHCMYNSNNSVTLNLELDVIQTYLHDLNLSDCVIERAHMDRFVKSGDVYRFNNGKESPLLNTEGMDLPKRLTNREIITPDIGTDTYSKGLIEGKSWAYIYIDANAWLTACKSKEVFLYRNETDNYDYDDSNYTDEEKYLWANLNAGGVELPYVCLVAQPVSGIEFFNKRYRNGVVQVRDTLVSGGTTRELTLAKVLESLYVKTGLTEAAVTNVRISCIPPYSHIDASSVYREYDSSTGVYNYALNFVNYGNLGGYQGNRLYKLCAKSDFSDTSSVFVVKNQQTSIYPFHYLTLDDNKSFTRDDIMGSYYYDIEPKALSSDVLDLKLRDYSGNSFSFDYQKLNVETVKFSILEPLTADTSKLGVLLDDEGLEDSTYQYSREGLMGLLSDNDTSMPFAVNQWDAFMVNNKNYKKMNTLTDVTSLITTITNTALGHEAGGAISEDMATAQGLANFANGFTNMAKDAFTRRLTRDNMKCGLDAHKNIAGNAAFNMMINEGNGLDIYAERYEAVDQDRRKYIDYLHEYGYAYGRVDEVKKWLNNRSDFNYIQARLESITSDKKLSNQVRSKLRNIFARGIRFWNNDSFDLSNNNIEWSVIKDV